MEFGESLVLEKGHNRLDISSLPVPPPYLAVGRKRKSSFSSARVDRHNSVSRKDQRRKIIFVRRGRIFGGNCVWALRWDGFLLGKILSSYFMTRKTSLLDNNYFRDRPPIIFPSFPRGIIPEFVEEIRAYRASKSPASFSHSVLATNPVETFFLQIGKKLSTFSLGQISC